jgi:RHS repeat-associated protein
VGGNTLSYVYHGGDIIFTKNITGSSTTDNFYADGLMLGQYTSPSGSKLYFQQDLLGSTRVVTNSAGQSVFSSDYEPYGTSYGVSGGPETFQYTGKPLDSSTGLYYYGSRFYDPQIARFITEDSSKGTSSDPLSLNRYIYVEDNPEKYVDPSGNRYFVAVSGFAPVESTNAQVAVQQFNQMDERRAQVIAYDEAHPVDLQQQGGGGDSSTTQQGTGFWNWFFSDPFIYAPFFLTVAGDVASIISPVLKGIFRSITSTLLQSIAKDAIKGAEIIQGLGGLGSLVMNMIDLGRNNLSAIPSMLATFAWNLVQAVVQKATWLQRVEILAIGVAQGLGDAASGGMFQAAMATLGGFQLITDISLMLSVDSSQYNSMYANG